ncbi:sensor histidine kinase [Roseobacter sp. HKCCA0434]|uniref:sensor histidine kinase n=1 Tax=Roseobacter sp. HKCCA0434 TaxID=3079297 RepID=UPI0029058033|nr:histidine kinase dimerization/phosphoacceptor domain -containing protein [Roseobacter sp. HKCCA0434]
MGDGQLARLQAEAWDQLGEGIILTDSDGTIVFVNKTAATLHGVAELGVETEDYSETYGLYRRDGTPYPSAELPLARAVRDGEIVENEMWDIRRPDGTTITAEGSARRIHDAAGGVLGCVLTIRDVTSREAALAELTLSLSVREMLLGEVNHRVANNLNLLASLVRYERRRTQEDAVIGVLDRVQSRLHVMGAIHGAMYRSEDGGTVNAGHHFSKLMQDVTEALAGEVDLVVECVAPQDMMVQSRDVIPLALAVNELMTNSLKYAFDGRASGEIRVVLEDGETRTMTYRDDGVGLPEDFDLDQSSGLGMTIVQTLARQLGSEVAVLNGPGAAFRIPF